MVEVLALSAAGICMRLFVQEFPASGDPTPVLAFPPPLFFFFCALSKLRKRKKKTSRGDTPTNRDGKLG